MFYKILSFLFFKCKEDVLTYPVIKCRHPCIDCWKQEYANRLSSTIESNREMDQLYTFIHWSLYRPLYSNCTVHCKVNCLEHCTVHCSEHCIVQCSEHCTVHGSEHCTVHCLEHCTAHCSEHCTAHCTVHCTTEVF